MTLEEGKPLYESRDEVLRAADYFEWFAEEARRIDGRVVPSNRPGVLQLVKREPIGPVAAFTPWNFPAITPARKLSAALAAGCSVILKPGEESPATALALARCLDDAGLPKGVLQIVFGAPDQISATLIASPVIRKVAFTGPYRWVACCPGAPPLVLNRLPWNWAAMDRYWFLPMQILKRLPLAGRRTGSGAPGKSVSLQPAF
jgi:acyl-CoA reductase-like NAD-dependent aldehyde dehydrogenase